MICGQYSKPDGGMEDMSLKILFKSRCSQMTNFWQVKLQ